MRSAFLWFLALLLMPSLILAKEYMPSMNELPKHGDYVTYSHDGDQHRGIVVGTEHSYYQGHPLYVAPMAPDGAHVHADRLVQMHATHPTPTGHSDVGLACDLQRNHRIQDPAISHVSRRRVYPLIV
ncbi:hypothetical protein JOM56_012072 [Amanita muscaria]